MDAVTGAVYRKRELNDEIFSLYLIKESIDEDLTYLYRCPDGTTFYDIADAIKYTIKWLNKEIT